MAVSLQAKSGNFGRPPDSIDLSPCNRQRLEWSLCQGFQASITNVSAGGAGSKLQNSTLTMLLLFRLNPSAITEDVRHRIHIGEDLIIEV
jgi:hypothetical protein